MNAFLYGVLIQWKLDLRNKGVLITYYIVPLLFFAFMSGVFASVNPGAKDTLIQTMIIFGVTMGALLGASTPLVELYGSEVKKAYKVGGIPLWVATVNNYISAFIHLFIMSLIIYLTAPIAFQAKVPTNIGLFFLSLAIFILTSLCLGTLLGVFIKSTSRLTIVAQLFFLPSIMLAGIMFPADMLPSAFRLAGNIFPATWGFKMLTSDTFELMYLLPLVFIMLITGGIIAFKLSKIGVE